MTDLAAAFASRNSLPLANISTDAVSTNPTRFRLGDSPLPAANRPGHHRRSLIPSDILQDPATCRRQALQSQNRHGVFPMYSHETIEPLLDRMRDTVHESLLVNDYVQLPRVAQALQPCELLRIERDA